MIQVVWAERGFTAQNIALVRETRRQADATGWPVWQFCVILRTSLTGLPGGE